MRIPFMIFTFCTLAFSCRHATQNKENLKIPKLPLSDDGSKLEQFTVDTLRLGELNAKKVIAYTIRRVTIQVEYSEYLNSLEVFWKRYKDGMNEIKRAAARGEYIDPKYEARWLLIDSVYRAIRKLSQEADTIHLSHTEFERLGLRPALDFDVQIEKGNCVIYNDEGIRQTVIIRQKGSLSYWGGRRYFLPGASTYFFEATDWVS
jgi:hypothetical protein